MFTTLVTQPLFNLLVFIYAIIPGHNFGLAIILFTVIIRILMWPLVKKQLHHAKAMRDLQPELKRIKAETKGNRQQESLMIMELYKEKEINPFSSMGLVIIQIPIFIALYSGLRKIVVDPQEIINFSYPFLHNFSWMKELASDITKFDSSLFGIVDLSKSALGSTGGIYWPAMVIVFGSAVAQFYQSKQLLPDTKDSRSLKTILKDASSGKESNQGEVNAAVGRSTRYFLPVMIFFFTVGIASALSLYWFVSGLVAYIQQSRVLGKEEEVLEAIADKSDKKVIEGEIISRKPKKSKSANRRTKSSKNKRRR